MVTNVTSLLKTVKSVEDEAAKGPRALEQTINSIKQEIRVSFLWNRVSLQIQWSTVNKSVFVLRIFGFIKG